MNWPGDWPQRLEALRLEYADDAARVWVEAQRHVRWEPLEDQLRLKAIVVKVLGEFSDEQLYAAMSEATAAWREKEQARAQQQREEIEAAYAKLSISPAPAWQPRIEKVALKREAKSPRLSRVPKQQPTPLLASDWNPATREGTHRLWKPRVQPPTLDDYDRHSYRETAKAPREYMAKEKWYGVNSNWKISRMAGAWPTLQEIRDVCENVY